MWGAEKAAAVQELVEEATGQPCPCKRLMTCPLLPAAGVTTLGGVFRDQATLAVA
jgi:hypothetical protein